MNGYLLTVCAILLIAFLFQKALSDRLNRSRRAREAEVAAAWNKVEAAFERVLRERQFGETVSEEALPILKARILVVQGSLSQDDYRVFAHLRNLRNLAVRGDSRITAKDGQEYLSQASRFVAKLETIGT